MDTRGLTQGRGDSDGWKRDDPSHLTAVELVLAYAFDGDLALGDTIVRLVNV